MNQDQKIRLAVLVSGRGSNLQSIIDASRAGRISAVIAIVISDKDGAPALDKAKRAGIETAAVTALAGQSREDYDKRLLAIVNEKKVDLVVLAGFMRIISPQLIEAYKNRIINIHPSLLPSFPGLHAQAQALGHGVHYSGATVHFVDHGCDTGPIILQAVVPVLPDDTEATLSERILQKEHEILPKAIDLIAKNRLHLDGRRVIIHS